MARVSSKRGLTDQEVEFCVMVHLGRTQTEAYRRSFNCDNMKPAEVTKKASALMKDTLVQGYLKELGGDVATMARGSFVDQLLDNQNSSTLLGAARAILDDEALQQERDDLEKFWMVAAACGAEVVAAIGDEEVVVPLRELMPKFKDATPPQDVLEKTSKSLEAWYNKLCEKEEELDARDRQDHGS